MIVDLDLRDHRVSHGWVVRRVLGGEGKGRDGGRDRGMREGKRRDTATEGRDGEGGRRQRYPDRARRLARSSTVA